VVIPVYGAPDDFRRCLASVRRHADGERERLIVVLDGPGQSDAETAIAASDGDVKILRHPERRGFVASIQTGIAASDGDVILLNSDTVVTAGWVRKLQAAAYSAPWIATVTPFSNDATLCSLPRPFESNALPAGYDADALARVVDDVSRRAYPRLPTGVGVCLYVKRAALDSVGGFDSAHFGLGYGEEVEFCLRALKGGWRHVLDDATFIYHAGQRSFGASRRRQVRAAERAVARLHPEYRATIGRFMREDPLRPLRARVVARLAPPARPGPTPARVLHVVHGWPPFNHAGTEVYARGLVVRQAGRRDVAVYARIADPCRGLGDTTELLDGGARVRLVVNNFQQRDPLSRNALRNRFIESDFARFVDEFGPALVHVHHLAGHSAGLIGVLRRRRIPYVFQLQDWWTVCARANLLRPDHTLCTGPGVQKCSACLPLTRLYGRGLWNPLLYALRRHMLSRAVRGAAAVVAGSRFVEASARTLGILGTGQPCHVLPYGIEAGAPGLRPPGPPPVRFGVIGSIMPHKGIHVAVDAFRDVDPARASLDVWGDAAARPAYAAEVRHAAGPAVRFRGGFPEGAKDDVFAAMHVLLVPSLGLESFGLVVREAMARGVPVLASRRGALEEALDADRQGGFFDPDDPASLRSWIDRLTSQPQVLSEWSRQLPRVKSMDAHAIEIDAIYADLVASARTT
jgi:glycosyltransferase involved in cell wall biosynthesis/GT2 family glycosyltransferase